MSPKLLKRVCPRCNKGFHTYTEEMQYCNTQCKVKHEYENMFNLARVLAKGFCENCGIEIAAGKRVYCSHECRLLSQKADRHEEKLRSDANTPIATKKPRKGMSYEELNRRAEYKRLYDEFHINRQITGKSRDFV